MFDHNIDETGSPGLGSGLGIRGLLDGHLNERVSGPPVGPVTAAFPGRVEHRHGRMASLPDEFHSVFHGEDPPHQPAVCFFNIFFPLVFPALSPTYTGVGTGFTNSCPFNPALDIGLLMRSKAIHRGTWQNYGGARLGLACLACLACLLPRHDTRMIRLRQSLVKSRQRDSRVLNDLPQLLGVGVMPLPLGYRQTLGNDGHEGGDLPPEPLVFLDNIATPLVLPLISHSQNYIDICQGMQYNITGVKSKKERRKEKA